GTNASGSAALGNVGYGILLDNSAANTTIGGATAGAGNVISGNQIGIGITSASTRTLVQGNYVGTDATGGSAVPNTTTGIVVVQASTGNTIGGTTAAARNVISGNTQHGIQINNSSANTVAGNYIGLNASGSAALGNGSDGIFVNGAAT